MTPRPLECDHRPLVPRGRAMERLETETPQPEKLPLLLLLPLPQPPPPKETKTTRPRRRRGARPGASPRTFATDLGGGGGGEVGKGIGTSHAVRTLFTKSSNFFKFEALPPCWRRRRVLQRAVRLGRRRLRLQVGAEAHRAVQPWRRIQERAR